MNHASSIYLHIAVSVVSIFLQDAHLPAHAIKDGTIIYPREDFLCVQRIHVAQHLCENPDFHANGHVFTGRRKEDNIAKSFQ